MILVLQKPSFLKRRSTPDYIKESLKEGQPTPTMRRATDEVPDKDVTGIHNPKFNAQNRLVNGALDYVDPRNKSSDGEDNGMDRNLDCRG